MGLDAHVYCRCIEGKKVKEHPFPELLLFNPVDGAFLETNSSLAQYQQHDHWFKDSCKHHGYAATERLGNVAGVELVRERLYEAEEQRAGSFPLLLRSVVQDGVHSGDHIDAELISDLVKEVAAAKLLSFDDAEQEKFLRDFMEKMSRLCEASLSARHPIVF